MKRCWRGREERREGDESVEEGVRWKVKGGERNKERERGNT